MGKVSKAGRVRQKEPKTKKVNPFELKFNRAKHDVRLLFTEKRRSRYLARQRKEALSGLLLHLENVLSSRVRRRSPLKLMLLGRQTK